MKDEDSIPNYRKWVEAFTSIEKIIIPKRIQEIQKTIKGELSERKCLYHPKMKRGIVGDKYVNTFVFGPIDLPVDLPFVSSRWHERRNKLPLACDEKTWRLAWKFWESAGSYKAIKAHIERYGMQRAIIAEMCVNYDVTKDQFLHRCFCFKGENPEWPFLILRTGNERLMMAWFEWGWKTIPTSIMIRDCGHNRAISAGFCYLAEVAPAWLKRGWRYCNRPVSEKGETHGN